MKNNKLRGMGLIIASLSIVLMLISFEQLKAQNSWLGSGNNMSANDWFGTKNAFPVIFKTNNIQRMILTTEGFFGINVSTALAPLHVNGEIIFINLGGSADGLVCADLTGKLKRISLTGNNRHVLLGDGTFGTFTDNDWLVTGDNMFVMPTGTVSFGVENPDTSYKVEIGGDTKIHGELVIGNSIHLNGITDQITTTTGTLDFGTTNLSTTGTIKTDNITTTSGTLNLGNTSILTSGSISATGTLFTGDSQFEKLKVNELTTTNRLVADDYIEVGNTLQFTGTQGDINSTNGLNITTTEGNIILNSGVNTIINSKLGVGVNVPIEVLDVGGNCNIRGYLYVQNGVIIGQRIQSERVQSDTLEVSEKINTRDMEAKKLSAKISELQTIKSERITTDTLDIQKLQTIQMESVSLLSDSINTDQIRTGLSFSKMAVSESSETILAKSEQIQTKTIDATGDVKAMTIITDRTEYPTINIDGINSTITSSTGNIDFDNENLTTTGTVNAGTISAATIETDDLIITNPISLTDLTITDKLEVVNSIKVGNNSLWLTSTEPVPGSSENSIYTNGGDLKIQNTGSGFNTIINESTGSVGIGRTPDGFKLDVFGTGRFGRDDGYVRIGYNTQHAFLDGYDNNADDSKQLLINNYSGADVVVGGAATDESTTGTGNFKTRHSTSLSTVSGNVIIGTGGTGGHQAELELNGNAKLNNNDIYLRKSSTNHGLGYYGVDDQGVTKSFASKTDIVGPVLYGYNGGALGSRDIGASYEKIALQWLYNGNVAIGNPTTIDAKLHVAGDVKIDNLPPYSSATEMIVKDPISGKLGTMPVPNISTLCPALTCSGSQVNISTSLEVTGNATIGNNLILSRLNKWILHTPESNDRTSLYIAPFGSTEWNWAAQTEFANNGNVGFGTNASSSKVHIKQNGGAFNLEGTDHVYIQFFPDGYTNGRKGWFGYGNVDDNNLTIQNQITDADIILGTIGNGNVGIGTPAPNAKLTVGAALGGTALSTTLISNAGVLGGAINNELNLASIGFTSGNNSSLGIRAYRTAAGTDWTTTAIGLGMDVDNTVRAGASLWLHANGNVGIGTKDPKGKFAVKGLYFDLGLEAGDYPSEGRIFYRSDGTGYGLALGRKNVAATTFDTYMYIKDGGYVGIGTTTPDEKLEVKGTIKACKVIVANPGYWCDYVFDEKYKLPSLSEVEQFVKLHKHLPDVPSEKEVTENGIDVGQMNTVLLKKIEELTLYSIEQQKQIDELKVQMSNIKK